jgi:hypothetical protein
MKARNFWTSRETFVPYLHVPCLAPEKSGVSHTEFFCLSGTQKRTVLLHSQDFSGTCKENVRNLAFQRGICSMELVGKALLPKDRVS